MAGHPRNWSASGLLQVAQRLGHLDRAQAQIWAQHLEGIADEPVGLRRRIQAANHLPAAADLDGLLPDENSPVIPGCRLLARLGQGLLGDTWLVVPNDLSGLQVVKILATKAEPAQLDGLVAHSSRLDHHYLIPWLSWTVDQRGRACLFKPWLPGRDLTARQAAHRQTSERRSLLLARQLVKGLISLHLVGLSHSSIHPDNILLDAQGRALWTDYALPGSERLTGQPASRTPWTAPEIWIDGSVPTMRSDLYALGCVLFWTLARQMPFVGAADLQVRQHLRAARPDARRHHPGVSERWAKRIAKAMAIKPADRYPDPNTFLALIIQTLAELPPPVALPALPEIAARAHQAEEPTVTMPLEPPVQATAAGEEEASDLRLEDDQPAAPPAQPAGSAPVGPTVPLAKPALPPAQASRHGELVLNDD